ncbi:hypothetical protein ABOC32_16830 [Pseudomonas sp. WOUb67]|uniref:hypothetical protein n=1 Tax=Pseudomonas sp. WOUb67 TaxID=3161136 RepID=UPI003CF9B4B7
MSRAVTTDHIFFNESIEAFRPNYIVEEAELAHTYSYVLTPFEIKRTWGLPNCSIGPTQKVQNGLYDAYISQIDNPAHRNTHHAHLFGVAISSILTFIAGCPCKSTRNNHIAREGNPTQQDLKILSALHPITHSGPGRNAREFSDKTLAIYESELQELITLLHHVSYKNYITAIQAIRLVHLSHINLQEDFGLAYLLVVSAIEAISQKAIDRKAVIEETEQESIWREKAGSDPEFAALFKTYSNGRKFLKQRYVKFILTYAPVNTWEEIVLNKNIERDHYYADRDGPSSPFTSNSPHNYKHPNETYPSTLTEEGAIKLLGESYNHRSSFVHEGEQPPHYAPESGNLYFQSMVLEKGQDRRPTQILLPNYQLLASIAKHSILNWLRPLASGK